MVITNSDKQQESNQQCQCWHATANFLPITVSELVGDCLTEVFGTPLSMLAARYLYFTLGGCDKVARLAERLEFREQGVMLILHLFEEAKKSYDHVVTHAMERARTELPLDGWDEDVCREATEAALLDGNKERADIIDFVFQDGFFFPDGICVLGDLQDFDDYIWPVVKFRLAATFSIACDIDDTKFQQLVQTVRAKPVVKGGRMHWCLGALRPHRALVDEEEPAMR